MGLPDGKTALARDALPPGGALEQAVTGASRSRISQAPEPIGVGRASCKKFGLEGLIYEARSRELPREGRHRLAATAAAPGAPRLASGPKRHAENSSNS